MNKSLIRGYLFYFSAYTLIETTKYKRLIWNGGTLCMGYLDTGKPYGKPTLLYRGNQVL